MTSDAKLIVLRFRDILIPSGETIARHRTSIAEHGYCWWGWLFRDYERNPHVELQRIGDDMAGSGSFPIVLFDSGRGMLFSASCQQVKACSPLQRTPEPTTTPSYYNDRKAPAWFRLTDIEDADSSLVVGRTCIEMPSAAEECFVDLLGQPVAHIRDLRRQEVTLWVLG